MSVAVDFIAAGNVSYYGLGEHKDQKVERTGGGGTYKKVFADSLFYGKSQGGDVSIPFYFTSDGYGFVWNLPSLGSVSIDGETGRITWTSNATVGIDFWITTTSSTGLADPGMVPGMDLSTTPFGELLSQFAVAVGKPTRMPFWTTGFIQCKDRYRNQTQLLDVARGYVERGLPISMIVIDWVCRDWPPRRFLHPVSQRVGWDPG